MRKKDRQNEGIGITTIIVVIIVAVIAIYYLFSHRSKMPDGEQFKTIPIETPAPVDVNPEPKS